MASPMVYYCYECENELCTKSLASLPHCTSTIGCFKSAVQKTGEIVNFARGCITKALQNQNICTNITDANTINYGYDCCNGHFCNDGHFAKPFETETPCCNSWIYVVLFFVLLFAFGTLGTMFFAVTKLKQYEQRLLEARHEFQLKLVEMDADQRINVRSRP